MTRKQVQAPSKIKLFFQADIAVTMFWYGLLCIFTDLLSNTSMKDHFRELKNFNRLQTNCTQIQGQHQAHQQAVHDLITGFEVVCMAQTQCVMPFIGMLLVLTAPPKLQLAILPFYCFCVPCKLLREFFFSRLYPLAYTLCFLVTFFLDNLWKLSKDEI